MFDVVVIGLGNMGRALAGSLSGAGRKVGLWNRSPERAAGLSGTFEPDIGTLTRQADVLLLVLSDYAAVRSCLKALAGQLSGKTVITYNSGLPQDARDIAAELAREGAISIDAAILGYPVDIGSERVMIFHAGAEQAVSQLTSGLLAPLGLRQKWVGEDPGAAKNFDAALLCRNYLWMTSYLQSLALAKSLGLDGRQFTETSLSLLGPLFGNIERALTEVEKGSFREAEQASISVHRGALDVVAAVARQSKLHHPLLETAHSLVREAETRGLGSKEMAALYRLFEP